MKLIQTAKLLLFTIIGLACCEITLAQVRFSDSVMPGTRKPIRTVLIDADAVTGGCRIEIHVYDSNFLVIAEDQSEWFPFYSGDLYKQEIWVSGSNGDDDVDVYGNPPEIEDLSLVILGLDGRDNIRVHNNFPTTIRGGGMDDRLYGGFANDLIYGGTGNDVIEGRGGDDHLVGDSGDDQIWGHNGADMISGGPGADLLNGGAGEDEIWGAYAWNRSITGWSSTLDFAVDRMIGGPDPDLFHSGFYEYEFIWVPFLPVPSIRFTAYLEKETILDFSAEDTARHHYVFFPQFRVSW